VPLEENKSRIEKQVLYLLPQLAYLLSTTPAESMKPPTYQTLPTTTPAKSGDVFTKVKTKNRKLLSRVVFEKLTD
jgi:hypothetical protein